jgi:hypothetical protein
MEGPDLDGVEEEVPLDWKRRRIRKAIIPVIDYVNGVGVEEEEIVQTGGIH